MILTNITKITNSTKLTNYQFNNLNREEEKMKKGIHPKYVDCTIICACGEVIHTRSTKPNIRVDICSKCHPLFTGKQKFIDSAGRVDKFMKRYGKESKE